MNSKQIEISLVIPIKNEALHLRKTLSVIIGCVKMATPDFEVIVIDDGSNDSTWEEILAVKEEIPEIEGIRLSRNFGKERAICSGLEHAQGQAVIVMDGDLQHPPELIPQMVAAWRRGDAQVVECVKKGRPEEPASYRLAAKLFYRSLRKFANVDLRGASDYKLLDRQVVEAWSKLPERITFFRGMTAWLGFSRTQIEFEVAPRVAGETRWGTATLFRLALNAMVSFTSWPLRLITLIGIVSFMGAGVLGVQTLYMKAAGIAVTGFTTVILLLLSMNSMIMLAIGILGEYIAAIYDEVKGRPRYLIREKTL